MENNRSFYNEILTDHNLHPMHKHELADANMQLEGVAVSGQMAWALRIVSALTSHARYTRISYNPPIILVLMLIEPWFF